MGIAVDSTNVYWVNEGVNAPSAVMKVALAGGSPTTLVTGGYNPLAIAIDSTNVYWAANGSADVPGFSDTGAVMEAQLDGGGLLTLASAVDDPTGIAVDSTSVYWVSSGIFVCVDGGVCVPAPTGAAEHLVGGAVMKVPIGGGNVTTLAPAQVPVSIAVDASNVYWASWGPYDGGYMNPLLTEMPLDGGSVTELAASPEVLPEQFGVSMALPGQIAVDASNLYWIEWGGAVLSVPLGGGAITTLSAGWSYINPYETESLGGSVGGGAGIAVDSTTVYFGANGAVMSVPIGGGSVTTLATVTTPAAGPDGILRIAVDSTSVYWTNAPTDTEADWVSGGTVMMLTPK